MGTGKKIVKVWSVVVAEAVVAGQGWWQWQWYQII